LATTQAPAQDAGAEPYYRCQATDMNMAARFLPWWDFRQYVNVRVYEVLRALAFWLFCKLLRLRGYRLWMWVYETIRRRTGGIPFPYQGGSGVKTPTQTLDLQPGELVQIKNHPEILETLNGRNRNRGLSFDEEMVGYCGGAHRVQRRVDRIIDEKTGRMLTMGTPCIVLEGAVCRARFKSHRLFCPRSIDVYWREIWLRRIDDKAAATAVSPYQREDRVD
jgi:hypothetical protein